jgi:hypothetical protein
MMRTCIFCGAELPGQAGFCGNCGHPTPPAGNPVESPTNGKSGSGNQLLQVHSLDAATTNSTPQWGNAVQGQPGQAYDSHSSQFAGDFGTQPSADNEEEERRRKAAMLGFGLLGLAGEGQPPGGNVPAVHGTPQIGVVPFVQGTPQNLPQGSYSSGFYASQTQQVSHVPQSPVPPTPHPIYHPSGSAGPHPTSPHHPNQHGCAPAWLIIVFAAILIITSIISIGLTVLSPRLSLLSGSTNVTQGGSLQLHGTSFIPGSSVTFTLDDTTPLYFTNQGSNGQALHSANSLPALGITSIHIGQVSSANSSVTAGIDGTFSVTFLMDQSWKTGQHTIRASERFIPRSASITITVHQAGETPTLPTSSPSTTDTLTPIASPSVTPSPSTTPSDLSCISPASVTIGPVSEGYVKAVSTQVTLCASGSGTVNWTATWNHNQAPWLTLENSFGQIQAPGQQQINVSALATDLKAGNYSVTVTFSSPQGTTTETLNVTFAVQTGCIHTSQQALSFSGVAGTSDPQPQKVVVTNCGNVGIWSTSVSTGKGSNNVNWLNVTPTGGGLNGGASQNVTVSASILKTQLGPGTYNGQIQYAIGSNQVTVSVTLIVQAAPKIMVVSPNPPSFYAPNQCTFGQKFLVWMCFASISNSSQRVSLSWKSSSSGVPNITFKPSNGTLPPGGSERVTITVPENNCQVPTTLSFTGPANRATIAWSCASIP